MNICSLVLCFTLARFGTANDGALVVQRCSGTEAKLYDCWYYAVGACPVVAVECNGTCSLMCQNGGTLNAPSCTCNCAPGYTGRNCTSEYIIILHTLVCLTNTLWMKAQFHSVPQFVIIDQDIFCPSTGPGCLCYCTYCIRQDGAGICSMHPDYCIGHASLYLCMCT